MKHLIILFLSFSLFSACRKSNEPYPYTFRTIKNFKGTEVYSLAKHVRDNDTVKIVEFINENKHISIDTRDKYYGSSLLIWAIFNGRYEAFHCLLNHGANPNF